MPQTLMLQQDEPPPSAIPSKARRELDWKQRVGFRELMVDADVARPSGTKAALAPTASFPPT